MNDKLNNWTFSSHEAEKLTRAPRALKLIVIRVGTAKAGIRQVHFGLSQDMLEKAKLMSGDILDLGYRDGIIGLFQSPTGRSIHAPGAGGRCLVVFPLPSEYATLFINKAASEIEADAGRIAFTLRNA